MAAATWPDSSASPRDARFHIERRSLASPRRSVRKPPGPNGIEGGGGTSGSCVQERVASREGSGIAVGMEGCCLEAVQEDSRGENANDRGSNTAPALDAPPVQNAGVT
eukprot:scaffold837_cov255-Pinguiococcus_pyrenoidosus.AAC.2